MAFPARVFTDNDEATEAWNGVLFDRFTAFKHIVTTGLGAHGDEALRRFPPPVGGRVLDVGCGFGDTTRQLARLVGPAGLVVGVNVAERFVAAARDEAENDGISNARFLVADVQTTVLEGPFDHVFSRFGTMFFASPAAALSNVRASMVPGGRLCMVVWRRKLDNDWMFRAETVVKDMVDEPETSDAPRCGPGPFSMADADTTSEVLLAAGFSDIALRRFDHDIVIGRDLDEAVAFATALGPAGEAIRRAGDDAEAIRPRIEAAVRETLQDMAGPGGVLGRAPTWIVEAVA